MPWSVAVMVIVIVSVVTLGRVIREAVRAQSREQVAAAPDLIASRDEVRQLKERVAVLERLVTDSHGSVQLDREIERLRDQREA